MRPYRLPFLCLCLTLLPAAFADGESADEVVVLHNAGYGFGHASFSPEGRWVAAAGANNTMTLWNAADGSTVFSVSCPGGLAGPAAFSPDGRVLATGHGDHSIAIRDVATGEVRQDLRGHGYAVLAVAFSPDGNRLASAAWSDGTIRVWDAATGAALATHATTGSWSQIAWFPDGKRLLVGGADTRILDAESGAVLLKFASAAHGPIALSPDGKTVATGTWGQVKTVEGCLEQNQAFLWDAGDGKPLATLLATGTEAFGAAEAVAFAARAGVCAVLRGSGHVALSTLEGKELASWTMSAGGIRGIAVAADGSTVRAACDDGKVRTWRAVR